MNVDRMRRYVRRHRPRLSRAERWAVMIESCGLGAIMGPYPGGDGILVPESLQDDVKWMQAACGITVDGVIGPQTWAAFAERSRQRNEDEMAAAGWAYRPRA